MLNTRYENYYEMYIVEYKIFDLKIIMKLVCITILRILKN